MNSQHFTVHAGYDLTIMKKVHSLSQGFLLMPENHTTSRRIMLVEDNQDINHLFWIVLQDAESRLNVDAFTDPYVALENFRSGLYDLLLLKSPCLKWKALSFIPESEVLMTESKYVF
jgi:hypothetical protein